jgi:hypothetical protein
MPSNIKIGGTLDKILRIPDKGSCRSSYQKHVKMLNLDSLLYTDLPPGDYESSENDCESSENDCESSENDDIEPQKSKKRVLKKRVIKKSTGVNVPYSSNDVYGFEEGINKLSKNLEKSIQNQKVSNITELISFLLKNESTEPLTGAEIIKAVGMKSVGPYCKWHKKYGYYEILKTVGRGKYIFNPLVKNAITHLHSDFLIC